VLVAVVALVWPSAFDWHSGPDGKFGTEDHPEWGEDDIPNGTMIRIGLGIIMLGMGLTLTLDDFRRVFVIPFALVGGVALQFTVMPILGWGIGHLMELPLDMAVGLVLVASCPGGTASNVVAFLARANVALSVSMTAISTTMAVVLTPLLTKFYVSEQVPVDALGLLQSILVIVILPVAVGIAINHFFGKVSKRIAAVSPFVSVLVIILIVGYILSQKRDSILGNWQTLVASVLMLHVGGFGLGYGLARLMRFDEQSSRTVSIEVGMQNSGLGTALATKHFAALPLVAVPCAVSAVTHCILGSIAAGIWRVMKPSSTADQQ
jgi:BASS family bile acid:Na+ symporter